MYGLFLWPDLAHFPWKKFIHFHEGFVTVQTLSPLQHCVQKIRLKVLGQGEDGKDCCKIKALTACFPSLLRAPSRAAWACLPHFSPLNSCTNSLCAKQQLPNLVEAFQSIQLTEFDMQITGATSLNTFTLKRKILIHKDTTVTWN